MILLIHILIYGDFLKKLCLFHLSYNFSVVNLISLLNMLLG